MNILPAGGFFLIENVFEVGVGEGHRRPRDPRSPRDHRRPRDPSSPRSPRRIRMQ